MAATPVLTTVQRGIFPGYASSCLPVKESETFFFGFANIKFILLADGCPYSRNKEKQALHWVVGRYMWTRVSPEDKSVSTPGKDGFKWTKTASNHFSNLVGAVP